MDDLSFYASPEEMAVRYTMLCVGIVISFVVVWVIYKINNKQQ